VGKKNKGVALIAVIVMIILFSSIILAVVLTSTIAIKRANFYYDKLIALEIAETGIQKLFYNLNYRYEEDDTGAGGWTRRSLIGSDFRSSNYSIPEWYRNLINSKRLSESDLTKYEIEISLPEYGGKGKYILYFIDANSATAPEADLDLIVCKGSYRGRTATISCLLRGAGEIWTDPNKNYFYGDFKVKNTNRTYGSCGISEAFNKHVIYATYVSGTGSIKGNITTTDFTGTLPSEATLTKTSNVSIPNLKDIPQDPLNLKPSPSSWDMRFKDDDGQFPYSSSPPYVPTLPSEVTYKVNGTYEEYTINGASIGEEKKWIFEKAASGTLTVKITGPTTVSDKAIIKSGADGDNADLEVDFSGSNNPNIQGQLVAERDIIIETENPNPNPIGTEGLVILWAGRNLIITTPQIKGDIIGINKVEFTGPNQVNLNGSINTKGTITIPSDLIININATNSDKKGAIILYNGDLTISSSSSVNITIGNNQISAILLYADTGDHSININSSPNFTFGETNQLAIIGYNKGGRCDINISGNIPRGIFSKGNNNNGNITLNSGNINGCLIANGTVNLNGGNLTYDSEPYKKNSEVYKGFVGGRRVYVPVIGSWRIEW